MAPPKNKNPGWFDKPNTVESNGWGKKQHNKTPSHDQFTWGKNSSKNYPDSKHQDNSNKKTDHQRHENPTYDNSTRNYNNQRNEQHHPDRRGQYNHGHAKYDADIQNH